MQFQLPLKNDTLATSWLSYNDAIDASYAIYSATLWLLNIANAFTEGADTSQGKRWLLGVPNRHNQNNSRHSQYSVGVASWVVPLTVKSLTYNFNGNIKTIDSGNIKAAVYKRYASMIQVNETTDLISAVKDATVELSGYKSKWYIATAWWNNFLIVSSWAAIESYPVDGTSYAINWAIASTVATIGNASYVACAKNQYVWVVNIQTPLWSWWWSAFIRGQLYEINSSWVLSTVGASVNILNATDGWGWSGWGANPDSWFASYVTSNNCYMYADGCSNGLWWSNTSSRQRAYGTIDMSTVSIFTYSSIRSDAYSAWIVSSYSGQTAGTHVHMIWWYDSPNSRLLYVTWFTAWVDIWAASAASFADTTSNYFDTYTNFCRYTTTTSLLTTIASNVNISATNTLRINNVAVSWTITSLNTKSIFVYKMTWSNQEDDTNAFMWIYMNCSASIAAWNALLKINGTTYQTNVISAANSISTLWYKDISIATIVGVTINANSLLFSLETNNPESRDHKIGLWLTWWTYASPTGTNDFWWSVSIWSTIGANWSKIEITLQ